MVGVCVGVAAGLDGIGQQAQVVSERRGQLGYHACVINHRDIDGVRQVADRQLVADCSCERFACGISETVADRAYVAKKLFGVVGIDVLVVT